MKTFIYLTLFHTILTLSFAGTGKQTVDFNGLNDHGYASFFDSKSNTLTIGGSAENKSGGSDFGWATLSPNGTTLIQKTTSFGNASSKIKDFAPHPDGGFFAAGNSSSNSLAIVKYKPDGEPDPGFGSKGIVELPSLTGQISVNALDRHSKGKFLIGGAISSSNTDSFVWQLSAKGTLDTTFSTDGKSSFNPETLEVAHSAHFDTEGKIVLAGRKNTGTISTSLIRLGAEGSLDTTFDTDGLSYVYLNNSNTSILRKAISAPDGKIYAGGYQYDAGNRFYGFIARKLPNGSLDETFGTSGVTWINFGTGDEGVMDLALDHKQRIVAVSSHHNGTHWDMGVTRHLPNGSLDASFNKTGMVKTVFTSGEAKASSIAVKPDGSLCITGWLESIATSDIAVACFTENGHPDLNFGVSRY